jgi:glucose-6-phosphate 1-dehydrogenase
MTDAEFRDTITERLTCRYSPGESCQEYMDKFLARCFYVAGQYKSREAFLDLYERMRGEEGLGRANRIYYMAIPPFLFLDVAHALAGAGLVSCDEGPGWSRAVVEKPFGSDRRTSDELVASLKQVFREDQTFRIDHYLGKEIIQNMLVLRFANYIFDPIWDRNSIESVHISWKETIGVEDRGGYFDSYGIIRDVMQNHLLQILTLVAMEQPSALDAQRIRDEKVKVLSSIPPVRLEDLVLGQYTEGEFQGEHHCAYRDEQGVAPDSTMPTYCAVKLRVNNRRWDGVPFYITAGKALDEHHTLIRIQFRNVPANLFSRDIEELPPNQLVIRVQPDEAIFFKIVNKTPGLTSKLVESQLNLRYQAAFDAIIPDAYESLLLEVIKGDKSLFIREDVLRAAWDIWTPVLHELNERRIEPKPYPFGSAGPKCAGKLVEAHVS